MFFLAQLFYQNNYEKARMCFERAGDRYWEKWATAAGLRAAANHMSCSNSQSMHINLMKAAETFDSIGKSELSAQCYYEANEYERAGITVTLSDFFKHLMVNVLPFATCVSEPPPPFYF